jgi:hypothetical protein
VHEVSRRLLVQGFAWCNFVTNVVARFYLGLTSSRSRRERFDAMER